MIDYEYLEDGYDNLPTWESVPRNNTPQGSLTDNEKHFISLLKQNNMKMESTQTTFNFHLDTKVTTWYRTEFEIEANSLEEAKKLAIAFRERGDNTKLPWEHIDDTFEGMIPDENGGEPTEELYDEDGNIIWDNTKSL